MPIRRLLIFLALILPVSVSAAISSLLAYMKAVPEVAMDLSFVPKASPGLEAEIASAMTISFQ